MSLAFPGGRHVASGTGAAPALSPQPGSAISPENRPRWHPEPGGGERQAVVTPRPERDPPSCPAHGETEARRGRALTEQPGRHRHRAPSAGDGAPGGIWSPAAATRTRCQPWCVPPAEGSPGSTVPIPSASLPAAQPRAWSRPRSRGRRYRHPFPTKNIPPCREAPGPAPPQSPTRTPGPPERPYLAGRWVPVSHTHRLRGTPASRERRRRRGERPERVSTRLPPPPPRWQLR